MEWPWKQRRSEICLLTLGFLSSHVQPTMPSFLWRTVGSLILHFTKCKRSHSPDLLKECCVFLSLSTICSFRSWRFQWQREIWNGSIIPRWSAGKRTEESWTSNPPHGCTEPGLLCWLSHHGAKTCSRIQPSWWRRHRPPCWKRTRKRKKARRKAWRSPNPLRTFPILTLFPLIIHPHLQNQLSQSG